MVSRHPFPVGPARCRPVGRCYPGGLTRFAFVYALALALLAAAPAGAQSPDQTRFLPVVSGLSLPVSITASGDGSGRMFVCEKAGRIRVIEGDVLVEEPFLDITVLVDDRGVEQGLLSVAFPPDYAASGRFYVAYTNNAGNLAIARYRVSADPRRADPASAEVFLVVRQPTVIHQSGQLAFGPDGYLYVGSGDGGDNLKGPDVARDPGTLLGKILRLDVSGETGYEVPPDNPFVGDGQGLPEVFAVGLRNPWRFSFDRETGGLFISDVGDQRVEEINWIPAGSGGGQDFGWRVMEGGRCFQAAGNCLGPNLTLPILQYTHDAIICRAVIGGYAYRGRYGLPVEGAYIFGDFCTRQVFIAPLTAAGYRLQYTLDTPYQITSFGEGEDGELYLVDFDGGAVLRIDFPRPAPRVTALEPPQASRGRPAMTMTLVGENFTPDSEVRWNGRPIPSTYIDRHRLEVRLEAEQLAATGVRQVTVSNPTPGGGLSDAVLFEITAEPQPPTVAAGGVVNAAGFRSGRPLASGTLAAVFGEGLAQGTAGAGGYPLPTELAGTRATLDGTIPVPLVFASWEQVNLLLPWDAPERGMA